MNASNSPARRAPRSRADRLLDTAMALSLFTASASVVMIALRWLG